jgi:hypothetical protein
MINFQDGLSPFGLVMSLIGSTAHRVAVRVSTPDWGELIWMKPCPSSGHLMLLRRCLHIVLGLSQFRDHCEFIRDRRRVDRLSRHFPALLVAADRITARLGKAPSSNPPARSDCPHHTDRLVCLTWAAGGGDLTSPSRTVHRRHSHLAPNRPLDPAAPVDSAANGAPASLAERSLPSAADLRCSRRKTTTGPPLAREISLRHGRCVCFARGSSESRSQLL